MGWGNRNGSLGSEGSRCRCVFFWWLLFQTIQLIGEGILLSGFLGGIFFQFWYLIDSFWRWHVGSVGTCRLTLNSEKVHAGSLNPVRRVSVGHSSLLLRSWAIRWVRNNMGWCTWIKHARCTCFRCGWERCWGRKLDAKLLQNICFRYVREETRQKVRVVRGKVHGGGFFLTTIVICSLLSQRKAYVSRRWRCCDVNSTSIGRWRILRSGHYCVRREDMRNWISTVVVLLVFSYLVLMNAGSRES